MNLYDYPQTSWPEQTTIKNSILCNTTQILLNDVNLKPSHIAVPAEFSEFYIKRNSDTLLIVVGESWTYGEGFEGVGTGIGKFNFHAQLENCLGCRMAEILGSDLYQYSVPGNCNLYIHVELERILKYVATLGYKQVKVAVLMTENARELSLDHLALADYPWIWDWYQYPKNNKIELPQWIKLYDELFFNYFQNILDNFTACPIEGMVFRNFTQVATEKRDYSFKIIEETWVEYTSKLINVDFEAPLILVPIAFENYKNKQQANLQIDLDFMDDQMDRVTRLFDIIGSKAGYKNTYHNNHPNALGHLVWANRLLGQTGWKDV